MMACDMTRSEKKRALWEALGEIRLDSEEESVEEGSQGAKNISSISTDILSAGCGSCTCCKNIEAALRSKNNTSREKRPTTQNNIIAPTPTRESTESSRNERCREQDNTLSTVQDENLILLEADSVQASAEVATKKKRKKRRVRLTVPSLPGKRASKQKASTSKGTKSPRKTSIQDVKASTEQVSKLKEKTSAEQEKPSTQNGKAEANAKTAKQKVTRTTKSKSPRNTLIEHVKASNEQVPKVKRKTKAEKEKPSTQNDKAEPTKKATGEDAAAQTTKSSQKYKLEENLNIAKQKQTKGRKKIATSEDSPSTSGNNCHGLQKGTVTKSSKSVKQKLNFSDDSSPQENKKVKKRYARKRRSMSRPLDSDDFGDSTDDEDPEYRNRSVNVKASTKLSSSPRKKKKTNKEGLPPPLEISETLKSPRRPPHILANIDNQVFKISIKENTAEFTKNLSRKLGRRGGASLNSSVLNESINFKPTEKKKKLYSDRAWTSSQLFMSLCGQPE